MGQRFAGIGAGLSAVSAAHSVVEHLTAGGWTRVSAPGTSYPLTDVACVTAALSCVFPGAGSACGTKAD